MAKKKSEAENKLEFIRHVLSAPRGPERMIKTPEEFEEKALAYFNFIAERDLPITKTGLILFMGFSDRQSFRDYQKIPEFSDICERLNNIVINHYEQKINTDQYPTGAIFALKNMGWKAEETQTQEVTQKIKVGYGKKEE